MFLEMADDGLNGGTPFELALDLRRDAALLAARVDLELVIGWGVVAAIASIGDAAMEDVADERLHLRNDRGERVPVIGIAGQCCGTYGLHTWSTALTRPGFHDYMIVMARAR